MKQKNGIFLGLIWIGISGFAAPHARATVYPDQDVQAQNENENVDATSRFGSNEDLNKSRNEMRLKSVSPISEDSFAGGVTTVKVGSRAPAGVNPRSADAAPKSAIIREAKKKKLVQEVAIIANELGFYPSTLFVTEGIPVKLYVTGASPKTQCFMLDQFGVRRQVRSQKIEEVTFTPDHTGSFSFRCPMNGAKGMVVVKELEVGTVRSPASEP